MEEHLKAELRGLAVHDLHEEPCGGLYGWKPMAFNALPC
jgi:hypothetical protein